jgi:hypothetical protein
MANAGMRAPNAMDSMTRRFLSSIANVPAGSSVDGSIEERGKEKRSKK